MIRNYLKNIRQAYEDNPAYIKMLLLFSYFVSFIAVLPVLNVILEFKPAVKDFSKHIISNAAYTDLDIASRLKLYNNSIFLFVALGLIIFMILFKVIKNRFQNAINQDSIGLISTLSIIGIAVAFSGLFLVNIDFSVSFILLACLYLLLHLGRADNPFNKEGVFWVLFISFPFTTVAYQFFLRFYGSKLPPFIKIDGVALACDCKVLVWGIIMGIFSMAAYLFLNYFYKKQTDRSTITSQLNILYFSTIPFMFLSSILCLLLELCNIINIRTAVVFSSPFLLFIILSLVLAALSYFRYRRLSIKGLSAKYANVNPIKKYYYPLMILGLGMIACQPWKVYYPENEFFEFANHGLAVDHFFRYGMIPFVETFDAHMFSNQIFAYFYGFANGYEPWSPFLYSRYILVFIYVLSYYVLKNFTGRTSAVILCLCFPMLNVVSNEYILCGFVGLTLLALLRNRTIKNFYWFWFSIISVCLYKLDLGFAAMLGGVVSYFILQLILRKPLEWKKLFISAAFSFGSILAGFVILCVVKGINPISRFYEFMVISMSNQNWGVDNIGDNNNFLFRILYYSLPVLLCGIFMLVIIKSVFIKEYIATILKREYSFGAFVFFIFFALLFFFNLPRGIVRHSIFFDNALTVTGTVGLALTSFIYIKKRESNLLNFLFISLVLFLCFNLKEGDLRTRGVSYLHSAITSTSFGEQFQPGYDFHGTRKKVTFDSSEITHFKSITDQLLAADETYIDFSSKNYLYALVGRKNPLYVNQSPLMLNGDDMQKMALDEIKSSKAPMVLMPKKDMAWSSIDGIMVEFKYFLLSEYIYENYVPFLSMSTFDIYVLKNKKALYDHKIAESVKAGGSGVVVSDFSFIDPKEIQQHDIVVELTAEKKLLLNSATGGDPFIFGFINRMQIPESFDKVGASVIKIKVHSETEGIVQLFFQMPNESSFTEEGSKKFTLVKGDNELALNLNSFPQDLRMDCDVPQLTIAGIQIYNPQKEGSNNIIPDLLSYDIGEIPRLWAEKDGNELFSKIKPLDYQEEVSSLVMNLNSKGKRKASYLFIEATADTISWATVELFDSSNSKKLFYNFRLKANKHSYAIRLSSNYHWWHSDLTKLTLNTEKRIKISKFVILSEDGKSIISANDNVPLTLSNVTDVNWYGGVGLKENVLLMDNSARNRELLGKNSKIQFSDGSFATIKKHTFHDNFIHVEVNEDVQQLKAVGAFPNNIKMTK